MGAPCQLIGLFVQFSVAHVCLKPTNIMVRSTKVCPDYGQLWVDECEPPMVTTWEVYFHCPSCGSNPPCLFMKGLGRNQPPLCSCQRWCGPCNEFVADVSRIDFHKFESMADLVIPTITRSLTDLMVGRKKAKHQHSEDASASDTIRVTVSRAEVLARIKEDDNDT